MSDAEVEIESENEVEEVLPTEEKEVLSSQDANEKEDITDAQIAESSDIDKVEEYFRQKDVSRTLRNDLKDLKVQMEETEELDKLNKRVKELREKIKGNESIHALTDKIQAAKERMDLLKELIRIELLESSQEEVKRNGRKLKIVNILREMKDEGDKKKKPARQFFRN